MVAGQVEIVRPNDNLKFCFLREGEDEDWPNSWEGSKEQGTSSSVVGRPIFKITLQSQLEQGWLEYDSKNVT